MPAPRAIRYRCCLSAHLQPDRSGDDQAQVLELSEQGAFLALCQVGIDLEPGEGASLTLSLPGGDRWRCRVRVIRHGRSRLELEHPTVDHLTKSVSGIAVEFDEVPEEELKRLRAFLEVLDAR